MEKLKNRYYIRTYGCQMNKYDSELLQSLLHEINFTEVENEEDADYIFLNTCSVRENAEKRVVGRLDTLKGLKEKNSDVSIILMGCVASHHPELIEHPVVDYLAPPDSYRNLIKKLKKSNRGIVRENKLEKYEEILPYSRKVSSYISVTRGCNYFCSYCIVPYTRGTLRSRKPEDILKEGEILIDSGVKEIILLGQNINAYNYKGINFTDLLGKFSKLAGLKRLQFLTSNPGDLPSGLFETISSSSVISNFLHLPLQSGSNRILHLMSRNYNRSEYIKIIERARRIIPDLYLTTDLMVGYPGEKEEDYRNTIDTVKRLRFDRAFMFAYSNRKGTLSSLLPGQISEDVKHKRLKNLIEIQNRITRERAQSLIGKESDVLIITEGKKGGKIGKDHSGRIIVEEKGVAKIGTEYKINIEKINGWVPVGNIKKEEV